MNFTVWGEPVPKARSRLFRMPNGRMGAKTPERTVEWESKVREAALQVQAERPIDGPVSVAMLFVVRRPQSVPRKRRFPMVRPDLDNLVKSVLDGILGVLIVEDGRVVDLVASKRYAGPDELPRVTVTIQEADFSSASEWLEAAGLA